MRNKTIAILLLFSGLLLYSYKGVSWGRLKDPGILQDEIQREWALFARTDASSPVKGNYPYMSCFESAAGKYNVSLPLLLAVARGESNFDSRAKSSKDCFGIMQIRWPGTAKELGIKRKADLFDPCVNIHAGARYLSWLVKKYEGDLYLSVAAYNYGPNAIRRGKIPEGAGWYAAYIQRHLQSILSNAYEKTGRALILEFTTYNRAAGFISYLERQVSGLPFEIFKSHKYSYDVYITYNDPKEMNDYLQRLADKAGIKTVDGGGT